jgi:hypothetical protein
VVTDHEKIVLAVKEALQAERDEFWIPQPKHYLDHQLLTICQAQRDEWIKNHEFITTMRTSACLGKKVSITVLVTALIGFAIKALWVAIHEGPK